MATATPSTPASPKASVFNRSIAISSLAFLGGVLATLIVIKAFSGGTVVFSVTEIISFVFGVALASASIVLAITAISLGRISEQAMVARSDESIRLQNEVFVKTTDALSRIESSTGVTEKRIEDIIAGRAGAIAERLVDDRRVAPRSREEIEKEIRDSLREELPAVQRTSEERKELVEHQAKLTEAQNDYDKFKNLVLYHISDLPDTKTRKIGNGRFRSSGDALADGVFEIPLGRIAVCTFSTNPIFGDFFGAEGTFVDFLELLLNEVASDTFHNVFLIFDAKLESESTFTKQIGARFSVAKTALTDRIQLVSGELPEVLETLTTEFASLSAAA